MDGWPNRRKNDAFSNLFGLVWTGPKKLIAVILAIDEAAMLLGEKSEMVKYPRVGGG